ncbi:class I adenylate-forming enzyme family protein [Sporichthya sp.]|uniref:class I adenylate-forming enzyme family protein n=1 Tax=Sporichthya sp. TaxID=65475 RepID=UPI0017E1712C|nr:AMP-binding protein [Sporichthya sp.]MBA3741352.1 AMP-binding protein [Sporichthya sp.]
MTSTADTARRQERYEALGMWTQERLGWLIEQNGQRWPDREFTMFKGVRYSYGEFARWVRLTARDLVARGIGPGDRVLVQLPNCLEALLLQLAAFRIGAVVSPVVPIYREHEMKQILADLRPKAVVVSVELGQRRPAAEMANLLDGLGLDVAVRYCVGGPVDGWATLPELGLDDVDPAQLPDPAPGDECALVLYTSGTTAAPKGAMLSGRAIMALGRTLRLRMGIGSDDVIMNGTPVSHVSGFVNGFLLPAVAGCRTVLLSEWKPDDAVDVVEQEGGTFMSGGSVFLLDLVQRYEAGRSPDHRLSKFLSGGAPTPASLFQRAEGLGITVLTCYGMTETGGPCTLPRPEDPPEVRMEFDGLIGEGTEIQAVDENRKPLPHGQTGELRIRGPQVMAGYTNSQVSAAQLDEDGWFYSGDVGFVTEDGWLRMVGRIKDLINRGGEKFSCQDIEAALVAYPDIDRAAVVGVPDERFGEAVGAFVTLMPGAAWAGPEKVIDFLEQMKLAKQKRPVVWHVLPALPTTPSGKVQKNKLLEMHLSHGGSE